MFLFTILMWWIENFKLHVCIFILYFIDRADLDETLMMGVVQSHSVFICICATFPTGYTSSNVSLTYSGIGVLTYLELVIASLK